MLVVGPEHVVPESVYPEVQVYEDDAGTSVELVDPA